METNGSCWCGGATWTPFDDDYGACDACGTLFARTMPQRNVGRVDDDRVDFYGRDYWFGHQQALGLPDLRERAERDLTDRGLHWLWTALLYKLPPGRALDVGCSHGGFAAVLGRAGFESTGVDLSPSVAEFARRNFEVPVWCGPLEDHDLEPASLDMICMMDVLEHLADPVTTVRRCFQLLRPEGVLLIQTPCRPADAEKHELIAGGHRFLEMLLPDEHLYLFSRSSAEQLLRCCGARDVASEPAIFAHYDMFLVAARTPLRRQSSAAVRDHLRQTVSGRLLLAMCDLRGRVAALEQDNRRLQVGPSPLSDTTAPPRQEEQPWAADRAALRERTAVLARENRRLAAHRRALRAWMEYLRAEAGVVRPDVSAAQAGIRSRPDGESTTAPAVPQSDGSEVLASEPSAQPGHPDVLHAIWQIPPQGKLAESCVSEVMRAVSAIRPALIGLYSDGWTACEFLVGFAGGSPPRRIEMELSRKGIPFRDPITVEARSPGRQPYHVTLGTQTVLNLRCVLPSEAGFFLVRISPGFVPHELTGSRDRRRLGLQMTRCRLLEADAAAGREGEPAQEIDLLAECLFDDPPG